MPEQPNAASERFLTFRVGAQLYALRTEEVQEVIRPPTVARVPQSPQALLGLANLRGGILPVIALHTLLGKAASAEGSSRAIVLNVGAPAVILVDAVERLESASAEQIDTRSREIGAEDKERLTGAFTTGSDARPVKVLDIRALLESAFTSRARSRAHEPTARAATPAATDNATIEDSEQLVTFEVAGQEFGLPLLQVAEILPAPATLTTLTHSDAVVLGLTAVRETLLPLLSLRGLLGLPARANPSAQDKVVVVKVGGMHVGLVVDRARAILSAETRRLDPVPLALAARVGGESRIRSVYRGDGGRRLIPILSPEHLFREDVMQRLSSNQQLQQQHAPQAPAKPRQEAMFLVFRLGEDEYGLPIDSVVEVARVPEQITRVPKTPKFLEGVVNLRGEVLPVVDQRRRFDLPAHESGSGRRLIVVITERHRAGIIVDSVSDVVRSQADAIEPAPQLTEETSRLVRGVLNLQAAGRIVLLLDPTELLTRAEHGLLDKFHAERQRASA